MSKPTRRGYVESDEKEFKLDAVDKLKLAGMDIIYLINKGYNIKGASTFVGNHFLLSARQRMALIRIISPYQALHKRIKKERKNSFTGISVNIDGFNTIITLEVAISGSILLRGMDGTIRDMAGLRGTYKLIDITDKAIMLLGEALDRLQVAEVNIYLDAPVSNSGNLKARLYELLQLFSFKLHILCVNQVDKILETLDNVVTSDSIILDKCIGWVNLNSTIIDRCILGAKILNLDLLNEIERD
ncbi:MAG: hypothetical protein K0S61_2183 [Anaerocolumna sp.]|jgi:hypothetical protein|nr:hypothetical protein [Anaerocolumna sp.]